MIKDYSLQDLEAVAQYILKESHSKILLFNGEMGVGKTTLIKTLVKMLGSTDSISSPTYSLVNEYKIPNHSIFHFDLYRIEDEEELYNFGIEDYLSDQHWIFVEWPEILLPLIQSNYTALQLETTNTSKRKLTLNNITI